MRPLMSIIIPTHNRIRQLKRLLGSLSEGLYYSDLEVIVVSDNNLNYDYKTLLNNYPWVRIVKIGREVLPALARQLGAAIARGDFLFFIDDDNIVDKNTIKYLLDFANSNPEFGIIGPLMFYYRAPNVIWCAGGIVIRPFYIFHHICQDKTPQECKKLTQLKVVECDYIPNAYVISKRVFNLVGGFDYKRFPIALEEVDLAYRVKMHGYKVGVLTKAIIWHDVPLRKDIHITAKRAYFRGRSRIMFYKKYDKKRLLLTLIDIFGFLGNLRYIDSNEYKIKVFSSFINGIIDGITNRNRFS